MSSPKSPYEQLVEFERFADQEIAKLDLWKLPLRTVLTMLLMAADGQFIGGRLERRREPEPEKGTAIISRISYVLPYLRNCTPEIGYDLADAIEVARPDHFRQINLVLAYAHFCEVMPQVHKGTLSVSQADLGFKLTIPSHEFAEIEELDVILSELALPHFRGIPFHLFNECLDMVKAWPHLRVDDFLKAVKPAYEHHVSNVLETSLLTAAAYEGALGFTRDQFVRTRAALLAYADFCLGMAGAAEALSNHAYTNARKTKMAQECLEWVVPLILSNHLLGVVAGLTGVHPSAVEKIVERFTVDIWNKSPQPGGEGFTPPFFRFQDSLLFSPHTVRYMMPERNMLYTMNKSDRRRFDNVVSEFLEPALISDADDIFRSFPNLDTRKNIVWENGEIDLLVLDLDAGTALQIQAKSAIPPHGARMVARMEDRTLEAIAQIDRFSQLPPAERDRICLGAFGYNFEVRHWESAILARSCLGTVKAWSELGNIAPMNPQLIAAAAEPFRREGRLDLELFSKSLHAFLRDLRAQATRGWTSAKLKLFDKEIEVPLMDLNYTTIYNVRSRIDG